MTNLNYKARNDTDAVVRLTDGMIMGPEHEEEWTEYQEWLSKGNTPEAPDPKEEIRELTVQEKLERAGLTVDELKEVLGLK